MQRHKFARAFKITSFFALMLITALLTGTLYAAPKVGPVTPENSIIGQYANDFAGNVVALPNGNIVIVTSNWNDRRGAVTCLTPDEYRSGGIVISAANSLVGAKPSDSVGSQGITVLSNGNFVVKSPLTDNGSHDGAGAVTWVNGSTCIPHGESTRNAVVSLDNSLVGTDRFQNLGSYPSSIVVLTNGNYVVIYPEWDNGSSPHYAGAATWGNGTTGIAGEISAENSLVGTSSHDRVGSGGIIELANGHYVVSSPTWGTGGAATWVNGNVGQTGPLSAENSLIGKADASEMSAVAYSKNDDTNASTEIFPNVKALPNGNYVVINPGWSNGAVSVNNLGAVTWGNGDGGTVGVVSADNSLVGAHTNNHEYVLLDAPSIDVTVLANGNYVVVSPFWNNGTTERVGAITWGDGDGGTVGVISAANSLIGSTTNDYAGVRFRNGVTALSNGNYIVSSMYWDNGAVTNAGAVTWGDGDGGTVGVISAANSLVGSSADDKLGYKQIETLSNGHYVVNSPGWDNGAAVDVGAVTWGNGSGGTVGTVSAANSLIGSSGHDLVGNGGVTVLTNGNYVVNSPEWDNGTVQKAGAVTWGSGATGVVGFINADNSLVGLKENDTVGSDGVTALTNGNYVVLSSSWNNGTIWDAGAATWGNGASGITGTIHSANSLIGSSLHSHVGTEVTPLTNGNYVVSSWFWHPEGVDSVGAVTWGNGGSGTVGVVTAANSLVGSTKGDAIGYFGSESSIHGVTALTNGHYVVSSPLWNNGATVDVGAVTWGNGDGGTVGVVSPVNSLVGSSKGDFGSTKLVLGQVFFKLLALNNGHYLVVAPDWDNGANVDAGAIIAGDGFNGITGSVSAANALIETSDVEHWGTPIRLLPDSSFVVIQATWANGVNENVGAVTWSDTTPRPNNPPVLAEIGSQIVDDGDVLTFDADSTDSDAPARPPVYTITGAPEDASFNTSTGEFSWTAGENDGGQVFNVTVTVTDHGVPALSDSESFTITVDEVNDAPVLAQIGNQTVDVGATLTFDAEATNPSDPVQTLTFSITGTPEAASFDTATGEFSWTATEEDEGQVFNVTVNVTDDGEPALSDTEDFTITVNRRITNYLPNASFENAGTTNKTAAGWKGVGLTNNDKRVCDTPIKLYALDGDCAFRFQFNGATAPARTLQRHLNAKNFAKNDTVELRGMVKANGLTAGARLALKVVYKDGKTEAVNVTLMAGSYDYTPLPVQITLKRPVKKITVQIRAGSAKGIFFVDDMAVVKVAALLTIEGGIPDSGLRGLD